MQYLITIGEEYFNRRSPHLDFKYTKRRASRAVLTDNEGRVYLLHVTKYGYHKLPGGGIDEGETIMNALKREILEEVGCKSDVGEKIGNTLEYRSYEDGHKSEHRSGTEQVSYAYFAKKIGDLGPNNLEHNEIEQGFKLFIAKNIDEAISILESDRPKSYEGQYIQLRDVSILKKAKNLIVV